MNIVGLLNDRPEQIFLGSVLGDGNLHIPEGHRNARFQSGCKEEDGGYLLWKFKELEATGLFNSPPRLRDRKPRRGRDWRSWYMGSVYCPVMTEYHKVFYPEGRKIVPPEVFDRLQDLSLAVWYMDDGTLFLNSQGYLRLRLYTQAFTRGENRLLRAWIADKYNVHFRVTSWKGKYWVLQLCYQSQIDKFMKVVGPHIVSCMERKLSPWEVRKEVLGL